MATAFGARSLGAALVVHFDTMAVLERKTTASAAWGSVEPADDYQSGPERPRSKGSADLIHAHASTKQEVHNENVN
jgi:hypothetical protein